VQELEEKAQEAFLERREQEGWIPAQDAINLVTFGQWDEQRRKQRKRKEAEEEDAQQKLLSWWQKAIGQGNNKAKAVVADPKNLVKLIITTIPTCCKTVHGFSEPSFCLAGSFSTSFWPFRFTLE
jgi:hypothetical protein